MNRRDLLRFEQFYRETLRAEARARERRYPRAASPQAQPTIPSPEANDASH